ncbi:MAG: Wzz/FepE/Etk N-terminal domain-containing protein [Sphingobium sp.]|uniref:GumC family protein n=1 Tax=Sphingobium sp. TaxID=1912891 RepID=UPI0029B2F627|nr:Wzz/FepE/Etk N-terminal domain-containing protein [Sphingobium sp.]MDX3909594.1 Wzz/FepE/Etk N-terminal domain-containing protein [Sphingobium sp.]
MGNADLVPSNLVYEGPRLAASRALQPGTRTGYFGVADFFRILRRRWRLIAALTGVGMLITVLVLASIDPIYSASTTVVVEPPDTEFSSATPTTVLNPNEETRIETKVEILQSRKLARRAATTMQLDDDPEFATKEDAKPGMIARLMRAIVRPPPAETNPELRQTDAARAKSEAVVDKLLANLRVARVARSSTISITASSEDPQKAALIANRVIKTYIQGQIQNAKKTRERQIQDLSQRVAEVRSSLQSADGAAASYRARTGILDSTPENSGAMQVAQAAGLLTQAQADSAFETRLARTGGGTAATSPLLIDLRQQESALARRLGELGTLYGPGHPDVAKARAEMAALLPRIASENARVQGALQSQAAASQARQGAVQAGIGGLQSRALASGVQAVPLRALERNAEASNTLYMSLLNALNAKIASPADTDPDISVVSPASVPVYPSYPVPQRVLAVALLAFLALGVVIAFVIDTMDTTIRTSAQVGRLLGIPTLAMVPDLTEDQEQTGGPVYSLVESKPRSRFAEAMRNLLIELETRHGPQPHVVVVTSPLDGEGKNTIATSLAAAAAMVGRKAVVVDFDLRRPGIEVQGGRASGVVGYLSGSTAMEDLPVIQQGSQFATIAVGDTPIDPGAMIASPRLPLLLEKLRERYDFVILNAPPILPVRDAKTLTEHADSTLLVLQWGRTNPEAARVAMDMFERPITGAVINMVDYPVHARRRYGDAIHHIANLTEYYDGDPPSSGWTFRERWARTFRRATRRTARALHLA